MPATVRQLTAADWDGVGSAKKHDRKLMDAAKERARSDLRLNEWARQGHAWRPLDDSPPLGSIPRVHASTLSVSAFRDRYEVPNLPVVIDGCADAWPSTSAPTCEPRDSRRRAT